jgi:hypothetical protein
MKKFWLFGMIAAALLLTGCRPDPNEQFIQGTWLFANEFENERSGSAHVYQYWRFGGGSFSFYQEIAFGSPQFADGHYRILDSTADSITLELYGIQGTRPMSDPTEMKILLDRERDTVRISRVLYARGGP